MRKLLLFIILSIVSNFGYAIQVKPIKDNGNVFVKIAAKEQSRIFVDHDRIVAVRGLDGAYDLKKDETLGDIYIQPTQFYQDKAFNLFITTEQGHTYNVLATPLNIPAETIELKPLSPSHPVASRWERNSPYSETIIHLIQDMTNAKNPEGYAVLNMGKVKPKKLTNGITMRLLTIYRGDKLHGEVWLIKNEKMQDSYVIPRTFYQSNVLGAAIQNERLPANAETLLFRVVSDEGE